MTSDAEPTEAAAPRLISAIRYSALVASVLAVALGVLSLILDVTEATRNVGLAGAAVILALAVYTLVVTRAIEDVAPSPVAPEGLAPGVDIGAIMGALDEAVIFRDASGTVRAINARLAGLFAFSTGHFLGRPHVELLREIARSMDDPEEIMEAYQALIEDPSAVLAFEFDQVMPEQRRLRFVSRPASLDDPGAGRVDVITDVSEASRRAGQMERLLDKTRRTAESYQRGLLPQSIPRFPRVGLVAHYVAASGDRGVCGISTTSFRSPMDASVWCWATFAVTVLRPRATGPSPVTA